MPISEAEARKKLQQLIEKYNNLTEDIRNYTEDSVIRQFIDILLRDVLGWPIEDPERYKYELHTRAGRPDITLIPENGGTIFIEAKKFGGIKQLEQARYTIAGTITPGQLALPGMSVDRTPEEQQAINYAFQNGGTWAILTNFEKLRLFNARRDWLVLSFETPKALIDDFDLLWQLSYENILKGSLDQLSNQRHREEVDTTYLAFINEWRERLAKDIVANPQVNSWAFTSTGEIDLSLLRSVVQQFLDRLVVIRFAEDHLVLNPDTLRSTYELRLTNEYTFSMDEFIDRFFRRFDQHHNSSLFALSTVDDAVFSDGALMPLMNKLYEARYRSMPADILGNTYEQYLGKTLALENGNVITRDNLETRKKQGSYYTPQVIVRHIVDNSLGRYLYGTKNGLPDGEILEGESRKTSTGIKDLRVLDSACGSGSFLIYAYYVLAEFYQAELRRLNNDVIEKTSTLAKEGMDAMSITIELAPLRAEIDRITHYPRLILEKHLYGVDLDPQAAEIAVVNLMMRAMERKSVHRRLPLILNQNVKVGNSLIGLPAADPRMQNHAETLAEIRALRNELIGVSNIDPRHDEIVDQLQALSAQMRTALDADFVDSFTDLDRIHPFHWGVEFPEVFYDAQGNLLDNPGFQIVIGNPPWEILKPDLREFYAQFDPDIEHRLKRAEAERRIEALNAQNAIYAERWEAQKTYIEQSATYFPKSADYTRQGRGDTATHKLFIERMYSLLGHGGRLGYVVPSGMYSDLGTKELREMLLETGTLETLIGITNGVAGGEVYFTGIHRSFKITLFVSQKGYIHNVIRAAFRIDPRTVPTPQEFSVFANEDSNFIYISQDMIQRFSPDSFSIMEFQTRRDYEIAEKIYGTHPLISETVEGRWNIKFTSEFHMTNDRRLFKTSHKAGYLPLYEGKMFHQYDAFFASAQYWIDEQAGRERLTSKTGTMYQKPRLVYRDIARSTDERTIISAILPPNVFCNNKAPIARIDDADDRYGKIILYLVAILNSFVLDHIIRQKVTTTLNFFHMETLPVPRLTTEDTVFNELVTRAAKLTCIRPEYADLWQDVMGDDWDASQAVSDAAERQTLRDEIDALVAHLYGLTHAEFDHVLSTFPLVFPDTEAGRMKKVALLEMYDSVGER